MAKRRPDRRRREWLAQALRWPAEPWPCSDGADAVLNRRNDSQTAAYTPKLPADHPDYRERVAVPTMQAIDAMPPPYRSLVWSYDYVDVYRAWRRGWPPERIRARAEAMGGRFAL